MRKRFILLTFVIIAFVASMIVAASVIIQQNRRNNTAIEGYVPILEDVPIPSDKEINLLSFAGGKIIYSITEENAGTLYETLFCVSDSENILTNNKLLTIDRQKKEILNFCGAENAGIYILILESNGNKENIYLKSVSWDGNIKEINCLNDFYKDENHINKDEIRNWKLEEMSNGTVLVYSFYSYRVIDSSGTVIEEGSFEKPDIYEINFLRKNSVLFTRFHDGVREISLISKDIEKKLENISVRSVNKYQILKENENSLLIRTDWQLYRYDLAEQKLDVLWNWSDFGIEGDKIWQLDLTESGILECLIFNDHHVQKATWKNTVPPLKKIIVLGSIEENNNIYRAVAHFNAEHDNYKIEIRNYASQDGISPLKLMYREILSGAGPDIIAIDPENMDYLQLGEKGVLEDLTSYLAVSDYINEEDFIPSIYEAIKEDGRLYMLPTNFSISYITTNNHLVRQTDELEGFSISEFRQMIVENPGLEIGIDKEQMLDLCFEYGMYKDIFDKKRGFDQDKFQDYLEFVNHLPVESYYITDETLYKNGKVLFQPNTIYEVNDYLYQKSLWGDGFQGIGYPGADGNGVIILPQNCWGISTQSKHKEIAWEFIEAFFNPPALNGYTPDWPFPVIEDLFQEQLNEAATKILYTDLDGNVAEYPRLSYQYENETKEIYAAAQEDLEAIKQLINGAKVIYRAHNDLKNIIHEEVAAYFSGQKPAEAVSRIVNDRITIYMEENK